MGLCKIITYPPFEQIQDEVETLGKFIQFSWRGVVYLVFATKAEHRFHNQILAHFFTDHGLPHHWLDDETLEIDSDEVGVIGGGRFRYIKTDHCLELWDNSQAYGRFDTTGLAESIQGADHAWSGVKVVIND